MRLAARASRSVRAQQRGVVGAILVAVLVAACSGSSPTPPSPSSIGSAGPSPASSSPASSIATSPVETPWQHELDDLQPDGSRSLDSALRLFAMAFGPIPGVNVERAAPGTVGSASAALRVIRAHLAELPGDQRQAIEADMAVRDAGEPVHVFGGPTSSMLDLELATIQLGRPLGNASRGGETTSYSQFADQISEQAQHVVTLAAQYFGDVPTVYVHIYDDPSQSVMTYYRPNHIGCDVLVNQATAESDLISARRALSLDLVHCFQNVFLGHFDVVADDTPAWAWDGPAEFILLERWPPFDTDVADWHRYFAQPDLPLFERGEDAVGFYAQARAHGLDLATVFQAVLKGTDDPARFAATGAATPEFEDAWASGLARTYWGAAWGFDGPGLPGLDAASNRGESIAMASGATEAVNQPAYTNHVDAIHSTADIVEIDLAGHARLGDGTIDDTNLGPGFFCTTDRGCGKCPDGSDPAIHPTRLAADSILAISGGTDGTSGTVSGHDLDEFCHASAPPPTTGAVQVKDIKIVGGHPITFVDMVACDGPWGHWTGAFFGIGNYTRPMDFTVGGGAGDITVTVTPGVASTPHGAITVSGEVDVSILDDGTTMALSGVAEVVYQGPNGPLPPDLNKFSVAYPIEPADPGRCP
jgi:hypothetical protein